jgi:flagellar biogenesis protein FliO
MKLASVMALGNKEKVAVIEVSGNKFLIGVCASNISLLHHFPEFDDSAADRSSEQVNQNRNAGKSFDSSAGQVESTGLSFQNDSKPKDFSSYLKAVINRSNTFG